MPRILLEKKVISGYDAADMPEESSHSPFRRLFYVLLIVGAVVLCALFAARESEKEDEAAEPAAPPSGIYAAEVLSDKLPAPIRECLILLSAEELASVPDADGFQWPCGGANAAMMYDAQSFGVHNENRCGYHSGMDINGIGGENTDVGEPVRAAARGLVLYSGIPAEGWGNVVVLAHRIPGTKRIIQTLYAHLDEIRTSRGQTVSRGQEIGTIGTAGGRYLGHLHFEAIESRCVEAGIVAYHRDGTMNRMNPAQLIADMPAPVLPDIYDSVRRIRIRETYEADASQTQQNKHLPAEFIPVEPSTFTTP